MAGLEAVAALSALDRLDLAQDEEKITASYVEVLKNYPMAITLLSQAGITVYIENKIELAVSGDPANETNKSRDT